ncbi:MAG: CinA family protein [Propionibacteriaceae bacterium]|jgi:nicotinamide-nucleotide amidase|nr:CinA family protein [Propionibacteriaceae bacterium]
MTSTPDEGPFQATSLAQQVVAALLARRMTVATCESLTGGLICAALTSVAGSSRVLRGGLVTYAVDLKTRLAGVDPRIITDHGVVSREVACAMADGARRVCQADWAIAVTGVAGPGPSNGVSAGTVWLAITSSRAQTAMLLALPGTRAQVRCGVVDQALTALMRMLDREPPGVRW